MPKGLVYILTNPCLDGWVKIGMTERNDIESRLSELNMPANLPLSYRCYAVYKVDNPKLVEKRIHSLIDKVDASLHAREQLRSGRIREREFFKMSPETAYGIFNDIATLRNDKENLEIYEPTQEEAQEEEIAEIRTKRKNNSFELLGINIGETISFLFDETILATVADHKNTLEYQGETYSVSALAHKLLVECRGWKNSSNVNGWRFFTKEDMTLSDLRDEIEKSNLDA